MMIVMSVAMIAAIIAPISQLTPSASAEMHSGHDAATDFSLKLEIDGLEDLGEGWVYEGWLVVNSKPWSTGVFTVDGEGNLSQDTFAVSPAIRDASTAFVLTIEPSPDDDPAPSDVHILAGDIADGMADLSIAHPAAIGTDFADATGSYILGIGFTAGATADNTHRNGIWYIDSLDLPELPAGWVYEGWVVGEDGPISTGRFSDPLAMDDDGSGPDAGGPDTGPNYPGQDFLDPALDIIGYAAVISVEPVPDNSPAPFVLKPLVDEEITDVGDHGSQDMVNNAAASSPTGTATFVEPLTLQLDGLEDVGEGWAYEGWLIVDDVPVSTGVFTIDSTDEDISMMSKDTFMVTSHDRAHATAFVLTLEPSPDNDPAPSEVRVLAGALVDGVAELDVAHHFALGNDFTGISGSYILAAPSGGPDQPRVNGIWWEDPSGPSASLDLPTLPAGWVYEGWVVGGTEDEPSPISTGRFTAVDTADSDAGGPTAGPQGTPPYPGQDFVDPAIDLNGGYAAVISIEPELDNSPAPFAYKPLIDELIEVSDQDLADLALQPMDLNLDSLATGMASFMDTVRWQIDGLEALGEGYVYEGWLIVDGAPVSTGVFNVDAASLDATSMIDSDMATISSVQRRDATAFVLTIEPSPDADPAPSDVHLLGGDLTDGVAELSIAHPAAIGTDFTDAAGSYILGIGYPEGATDENTYANGIWYIDSLDLPELPAGWVYEGWVVGEDGPISTGRFSNPLAMDDDGSGPDAGGPGTGPNYPGQDFLDPATNILGYAAVISVEPEPDDSPAPFVLKPLVDDVIEDAGDHGSQNMSNNAVNSSPTGVAMVASGAMAIAEEMAEEMADEEASAEEEAVEDTATQGADSVDDADSSSEEVASTGPHVIRQGQLAPASDDYEGEGTISLVQDGDTFTVHFGPDFISSDGPGLYVMLVENADARNHAGLGEYIELDTLQSTSGGQVYAIPDGVDVSKFSGVMIYCKPFSVVFSVADFDGAATESADAATESAGTATESADTAGNSDSPSEEVADTGPRVIRQGQLTPVTNDYDGEGTISLVQDGDTFTLHFGADFSSSDGPGLYVMLVENTNARNHAGLGEYIELDKLQSTSGGQVYAIPDGVDVSKFGGAMIYCKPFSAVFSVAEF
ncbi:MAG: DM13 domain-containing protein [Chloroflexota bacterium]